MTFAAKLLAGALEGAARTLLAPPPIARAVIDVEVKRVVDHGSESLQS